MEEATSRYEREIGRAGEYLKRRGISLDTAERFRLGVVADPISGHEQYVGRLAIPSLGPNGPYQLKFRCVETHDCKTFNHAKYFTDAQDNRLFNLQAILHADEEICITEGEIDALTLSQMAFQAVAAPGANTWRRHHHRLFAGYRRVYIFGDGDQAGKAFVKEVGESLPQGKRIVLPQAEDVNSLYVQSGEAAIREMMGI